MLPSINMKLLTLFSPNSNFENTLINVPKKSLKGCNALLKKVGRPKLDENISIFYAFVAPVINYGSEFWVWRISDLSFIYNLLNVQFV